MAALAEALRLREDLTTGAKAALVAPLIIRLARILRIRFRAQKRWLRDAGGASLNRYPEEPRMLDELGRILTEAHDDGWSVAAAELNIPALPIALMTPLFLAGIDRTTEQRVGVDGLTKAFSDLDERAKMIGVTEIGNAFNAGALAAAAQGQDVEKLWVVHAEACPACLAAAGEGWIPQSMPFGNGYQGPTLHPNCYCSLSFRTVDNPVS